ncbi:hypothetical protein LCGC14_1189180 [marine sediment metagenome]|uniref:Uncharacterized protein n=1 Tax=marine sediment metagenome TaxID=412755 RepID=A0A0F9P2P3_9ZZZZ
MAVLVSSFGTTQLSLPDPVPPIPIAAQMTLPSGDWILTFDQLLQPGLSAITNWGFRANNLIRSAMAPVTISGNTVSAASSPGPPSVGFDFITYNAGIPDVIGVNGLAVEAFSGFPLTVL